MSKEELGGESESEAEEDLVFLREVFEVPAVVVGLRPVRITLQLPRTKISFRKSRPAL